jgi:hypothetical protein
VSAVKVRAFIGKELVPINWNRDMWEVPDEAGDMIS